MLRVDKVPGAELDPNDVSSDEESAAIDIVDMESLLSEAPLQPSSSGGDSSVIDLDAYLKN